MDPVTTAALATTAGGALTCITTITAGWLKARLQLRRAREESRRQHVRMLPTGSRIIDLGKRGIVIEVGTRKGRAGERG
ncbi:hypothetical protein OG741_21825 [Streptomyces sp. NBC_01410]|uniref:hypothetical protein n=1 Tax=Streptomyces sp. NBC_01410 TaxID=2903856 RepID=UPI00324459F2